MLLAVTHGATGLSTIIPRPLFSLETCRNMLDPSDPEPFRRVRYAVQGRIAATRSSHAHIALVSHIHV